MGKDERVRWNRIAHDEMKKNADLAKAVLELQGEVNRLQVAMDVMYAQYQDASQKAELYQKWIDVFAEIAAKGLPALDLMGYMPKIPGRPK